MNAFMKKITRRDVIRNVLKSAKQTYDNDYWLDRRLMTGETPRTMIERLELLNLETCSKEDVDKAWGKGSWNSMPNCGHCKTRDQEVTYEIGEESDYESHTAFLCEKCMQELVDEFNKEKV